MWSTRSASPSMRRRACSVTVLLSSANAAATSMISAMAEEGMAATVEMVQMMDGIAERVAQIDRMVQSVAAAMAHQKAVRLAEVPEVGVVSLLNDGRIVIILDGHELYREAAAQALHPALSTPAPPSPPLHPGMNAGS